MTDEKQQDAQASGVERIVMLPMPDGIQRVETGVIQFGDDWPGVYVRGDNALHMALLMRTAAQALRVSINDEISAAQLESYAEMVASCCRRST